MLAYPPKNKYIAVIFYTFLVSIGISILILSFRHLVEEKGKLERMDPQIAELYQSITKAPEDKDVLQAAQDVFDRKDVTAVRVYRGSYDSPEFIITLQKHNFAGFERSKNVNGYSVAVGVTSPQRLDTNQVIGSFLVVCLAMPLAGLLVWWGGAGLFYRDESVNSSDLGKKSTAPSSFSAEKLHKEEGASPTEAEPQRADPKEYPPLKLVK